MLSYRGSTTNTLPFHERSAHSCENNRKKHDCHFHGIFLTAKISTRECWIVGVFHWFGSVCHTLCFRSSLHHGGTGSSHQFDGGTVGYFFLYNVIATQHGTVFQFQVKRCSVQDVVGKFLVVLFQYCIFECFRRPTQPFLGELYFDG